MIKVLKVADTHSYDYGLSKRRNSNIPHNALIPKNKQQSLFKSQNEVREPEIMQ